MALQLGTLRTGLLEAGASEGKADRAAEEVAAYDSRPANIGARLNTLTWMTLTWMTLTWMTLTWMTGRAIMLVVLVLGGRMALWAKLGEIAGELHRTQTVGRTR